MPSTIYYAALALSAGIGVPIMATISSALGLRVGSTPAAAAVLFFGAFVISVGGLMFYGLPSIQAFRSAPASLYIGGCFVAFYIFSITWLIPRFGVANAIFLVLLGQIISAIFIDHFGLFNTPVERMSWLKLGGVACMIVGIFLSRR